MRESNRQPRISFERIHAITLLALAVVAVAAPVAMAQSSRTYDIRHNFWIQTAAPAVLGVAGWQDFEHAWATGGVAPAASWNPVAQPVGFLGYGWDWQDGFGRVWNSGGVQVNRGQTFYIGPPWPFVSQKTVTAVSGANNATASSQVSVGQFVPGGPFTGFIRSWGSANVAGPGGSYAFSSSNVWLRGLTVNWRTGRIRWTPVYRDFLSGSASAVMRQARPRPRDPINVRILSGSDEVLLEDTMLDITAVIEEGTNSVVAWENGQLEFSATSGMFHVAVTSSYIEPADRGSAYLVVGGGKVTKSCDDGIFDGYLPSEGSPSTFTVPFPARIEIDYEYPELGPNMEIELGGGLGPDVDVHLIPTLGHWGLVILLLALIAAGVFVVMRRRAVA